MAFHESQFKLNKSVRKTELKQRQNAAHMTAGNLNSDRLYANAICSIYNTQTTATTNKFPYPSIQVIRSITGGHQVCSRK